MSISWVTTLKLEFGYYKDLNVRNKMLAKGEEVDLIAF